GFDILIKAAKILELNNLDFEIVIAGDGEAKADLQTLTNTLRLNRYVRITGARRMEEILDLLRRAEVFVLPSRKDWEESTVIPPMGMLEAMASGMPVITTGTIPGLIDKETGRVVPVDNPEILANVISELLANHYLREKLGTAARERVAAHYNLKKNVDELYRLLLSSNQGDEKAS
ncbi:MAG TPA: glycosyltransferase, partial [Bacteroidetes bacterium]|nr:glycosyltransferase [Bacteroidota bacterium]